MRTDSSHINEYRNKAHPTYRTEDSDCMTGFFVIPLSEDTYALIIASPGCAEMPWDHVSVRIGMKKRDPEEAGLIVPRLNERIPTWEEMCLVKEIFWSDEECAVQFHPKAADYVNCHPCVLHLWKPSDREFPVPPKIAV